MAFFCPYIEGTYAEEYGREAVSYKSSTAAFHPPGETHPVEVGRTGGYIFSVGVGDSPLERLREYAPVPDTSPDVHGGDDVWLMSRLFREYKQARRCSPLTAEGIVLELLAATASDRVAGERRCGARRGPDT